MHSTIWYRLRVPALAVPAAIALAACSGDSTGPGNQTSFSQADADAAADVIVGDLSDQADGSTSTSSSGADFSMVAAPAASAGAWRVRRHLPSRPSAAPPVLSLPTA
jgi:hypothetical protein